MGGATADVGRTVSLEGFIAVDTSAIKIASVVEAQATKDTLDVDTDAARLILWVGRAKNGKQR